MRPFLLLALTGCSMVSVHDLAEEFVTTFCARMDECGDPSGKWHWDGCQANYMGIVCQITDCTAEYPAGIAQGKLDTCLEAFNELTCDEAFPWPQTPACIL